MIYAYVINAKGYIMEDKLTFNVNLNHPFVALSLTCNRVWRYTDDKVNAKVMYVYMKVNYSLDAKPS